MHAFSLIFSCLVTSFLCLLPTTKARSDELRQNSGVDSSTKATAQPLLRADTPSAKRWYINIEAARDAAKAAGMPIMIVFR